MRQDVESRACYVMLQQLLLRRGWELVDTVCCEVAGYLATVRESQKLSEEVDLDRHIDSFRKRFRQAFTQEI